MVVLVVITRFKSTHLCNLWTVPLVALTYPRCQKSGCCGCCRGVWQSSCAGPEACQAYPILHIGLSMLQILTPESHAMSSCNNPLSALDAVPEDPLELEGSLLPRFPTHQTTEAHSSVSLNENLLDSSTKGQYSNSYTWLHFGNHFRYKDIIYIVLAHPWKGKAPCSPHWDFCT